jgi:3-hydroxy-3-methylglutaryl CoA synthase
VNKRVEAVQQKVAGLFACAESHLDASEKTAAGYQNDLMNITALCNVEDVMDVVTNPAGFKLLLTQRCGSAYTAATYVSRILSISQSQSQPKAAAQGCI